MFHRVAIDRLIRGHVHKNFVNGVDMNIRSTYIFQIDIINIGGYIDVSLHLWCGNNEINRFSGGCFNLL